MASETEIFGLPVPEGTDAPPSVPVAMGAYAARHEAIQAATMRSAGVNVVDAAQDVSSTSYAAAGTPDRVTLDIPQDPGSVAVGRIAIGFRANLRSTAGGKIALFVGGVQLQIPTLGGSVTPQESVLPIQGTPRVGVVNSYWAGLLTGFASGGDTEGVDIPQPQVLGYALGSGGGECVLECPVDEDGVDIEVRYKSNSGGVVTTFNRKLWAYTLPMAVPAP